MRYKHKSVWIFSLKEPNKSSNFLSSDYSYKKIVLRNKTDDVFFVVSALFAISLVVFLKQIANWLLLMQKERNYLERLTVLWVSSTKLLLNMIKAFLLPYHTKFIKNFQVKSFFSEFIRFSAKQWWKKYIIKQKKNC